MEHDWSFLYDPRQFSLLQWLWVMLLSYCLFGGFMGKWLAKLGMLMHKHKSIYIYDISTTKDRCIMECGECGTIWSWDR